MKTSTALLALALAAMVAVPVHAEDPDGETWAALAEPLSVVTITTADGSNVDHVTFTGAHGDEFSAYCTTREAQYTRICEDFEFGWRYSVFGSFERRPGESVRLQVKGYSLLGPAQSEEEP